jgi:hypothetical protein
MGMDDFARAAAFSVGLEDALAGTLATWTGGTVVLDPAAPDVWDSNHLRLERRWAEAPSASPPPSRTPPAPAGFARRWWRSPTPRRSRSSSWPMPQWARCSTTAGSRCATATRSWPCAG